MLKQAKKTGLNFANSAKKKMWGMNVRATTRGMKPDRVLMANKYMVFATGNQSASCPKDCDFVAVVLRFDEMEVVRFYDKGGKRIPALLYHLSLSGKVR